MKYFNPNKFIVSLCIVIILLVKMSYAQNLSNLKVPIKYDYKDNMLSLSIANPFQTPIRIVVTSIDSTLNFRFNNFGFILLASKQDTIITAGEIENRPLLMFKVLFGDPSRAVLLNPMALPYPRNRSYKVLQGNFGKFSHHSISSKYALDFNLNIKDTVCAADDGYVIGIVKHHNTGGNKLKYYDNANYITLYHPTANLFSQYVHLMQNGSLVELGEYVKKGQAIGLAGATGFTSAPHLHFNVYKANTTGWESTPTTFDDGYSSMQIRKGEILSTKK
ncbi:M23 family metallopeptidase [Pedobacter aquatilis]|uniref:M23 family metallopeptidase n=1 Tax=Pedobacter aquatilis TaxID=351343 RepID=UPI0029316BFE|nr:M23 family metallopeptidase [Pedobacter aquatilis]